MTQEEIDRKIARLRGDQAKLQWKIRSLEDEIVDLNREARELDDPHVLIPDCYETIDEWLEHVPFPRLTRKSHTFRNRSEARDCQLCCNTYQECYHIKRLQNDTCARSGDKKCKQNKEI